MHVNYKATPISTHVSVVATCDFFSSPSLNFTLSECFLRICGYCVWVYSCFLCIYVIIACVLCEYPQNSSKLKTQNQRSRGKWQLWPKARRHGDIRVVSRLYREAARGQIPYVTQSLLCMEGLITSGLHAGYKDSVGAARIHYSHPKCLEPHWNPS